MHLTLYPDGIERLQQVTTEVLRSQAFPFKGLGVTLKFEMIGRARPPPRLVAEPTSVSVIGTEDRALFGLVISCDQTTTLI